MTTKTTTCPLQMPVSLKTAVERMAAADGTSVNHFLVVTAAEKLSAMETARIFLAARKGHGDPEAAVQFLTRGSGAQPRTGDEMPE